MAKTPMVAHLYWREDTVRDFADLLKRVGGEQDMQTALAACGYRDTAHVAICLSTWSPEEPVGDMAYVTVSNQDILIYMTWLRRSQDVMHFNAELQRMVEAGGEDDPVLPTLLAVQARYVTNVASLTGMATRLTLQMLDDSGPAEWSALNMALTGEFMRTYKKIVGEDLDLSIDAFSEQLEDQTSNKLRYERELCRALLSGLARHAESLLTDVDPGLLRQLREGPFRELEEKISSVTI